MKKITSIIAILALVVPISVSAATDGTKGATSTGDMRLSVTIDQPPEPAVQISGLTDILFDRITSGETPPPETISNICVVLENANTYSIELSSEHNGNQGRGRLLDTNTFSSMYYNWEFSDNAGTAVTTALGTGLVGSTDANCLDGNTASLVITPEEGTNRDLSFRIIIEDVLTLTVSPE